MKASKKHIEHLSQQLQLFIYRLSQLEYVALKRSYKNEPIKTMWNMYWKCFDAEPEFWRNETKNWKDDHIETMIKRAIKLTVLH